MLDSLEVDVDGISNGKEVVIGAVVEHIDSAGVHSGDAMMCIPPWRLNNKTIETIIEYTTKIATTFNVKGPFNLQFVITSYSIHYTKLYEVVYGEDNPSSFNSLICHIFGNHSSPGFWGWSDSRKSTSCKCRG